MRVLMPMQHWFLVVALEVHSLQLKGKPLKPRQVESIVKDSQKLFKRMGVRGA